MSVAEVSEISSTSAHSFEDAIKQGLARAHQTVRNVCRAWITGQQMRVSEGTATEYQVDMWVITRPSSTTETAGLSALDLERALSMADEGGVSAPAPAGVEECGDPP
jgi:dodecin